MDQTPFLVTALMGLGGYAAAITWWTIKHLQSDIDYGRKSAERGTELAEKAAAVAERVS